MPSIGYRVPSGKASRNSTAANGPYAKSATWYFEHCDIGSPVPVKPDKSPALAGNTGYEGIWPHHGEIGRWVRKCPDANVSIRLAPGVLGIDVDAYGSKSGADTLALLTEECGPLPATVKSTSRWPVDALSGIYLFRVAEDMAWRGNLNHVAKPSHIDIVSWHHRIVVCAPSVHPSGRPYRWVWDDAVYRGPILVSDLPWLPAAWVKHCLKSDQTERGSDSSAVGGSTRDWLDKYGRGTMCGWMEWLVRRVNSGELRGDAHGAVALASTMVQGVTEGHTGLNSALRVLRDAFYAECAERQPDKHARRGAKVIGEWRRMLDYAVARHAKRGVPDSDPVCDDLAALQNFNPRSAGKRVRAS